MEKDNKKTLILSIVGILVLVIAVVGVSFAMYSFTGTGTQNNRIITGSATLDFGEGTNQINITNTYPVSDEKGAVAGNDATFSVAVKSPSYALNIKYEVGLTDFVEPEGSTLTKDMVKVKVMQGDSVVQAPATISSLESSAGDAGLLNNYVIAKGTLAGTASAVAKTDDYKIYAWVSKDYDLAIDKAQSTDPEVSGGTLDNDGGKLHQKATKSETFSFKLVIAAEQMTA